MKPSEIYKNCTAKGCENTLSVIQIIDDNVTIGELRSFLEKRVKEAKTQFKTSEEKLIRDLTGKCFKIVFSPKHTVLLKVDKVKITDEYGYADAIMTGEQITNYEGQITHSVLTDKSNKKYSNYFTNHNQVEFNAKEFEKIKKTFKSITF